MDEKMDEKTKRIKNFVKYNQYYGYDVKVTNRVAHCNACKKAIDINEKRAYVNPAVVSQRFLLCTDCLQLYLDERVKPDEFMMNDEEYNYMLGKYKHLIKQEFYESRIYSVSTK